jgi:hypothetical protein
MPPICRNLRREFSNNDAIDSLIHIARIQMSNINKLLAGSVLGVAALGAGTALLFGGSQDSKAKKRKAFFSFQFDDVMRVNVVRNAWKVGHPDGPDMRSFYDSSLWERRQLEGPDSVKKVIREGVEYTSAVCVLAGSQTWSRRWVRYEIARAIIDERGLLTVHLNSIRHHQTQTAHERGPNPLGYMAVGKVQSNALEPPRYYLFERAVQGWARYQDYTTPVSLPRWLADMPAGQVRPLSAGTAEHDYIAQDGHMNIGAWIDAAAQQVGR